MYLLDERAFSRQCSGFDLYFAERAGLLWVWWSKGGSLSFVSLCSHPQPISMVCKITKTGACWFFFLSKHTIGSPFLVFQLYKHTEMLRMFSSDQSCTVITNIFRCEDLKTALNSSTETEQKGIQYIQSYTRG